MAETKKLDSLGRVNNGRKPKKIDEELLKKLAHIHCTMEEMSSIVGVSVDTLERRFAALIKKARDSGKMSLRRWQWKAAESQNIGMLIWLGKQHLGQSEKVEQKNMEAQEKTVAKLSDEELLKLFKERKANAI
jgi:AraC-like DNA-binding protein